MRNVLLSLLFLISLPATGEPRVIDGIAAIINDDIITSRELNTRVTQVSRQLRESGTPLPPQDILRKQVLDREILRQIQLQLASGTGIRVDDNALNNAINSIASRNNMSLRQLRETLEREGFDFSVYREDFRQEMIIGQLHRREIHNRVNISEQEVDHFLATQSAQGRANEEYKIRHILVAVPEAAGPEDIAGARAKAEKLRERLNQGEDFVQLAIQHSDGQNALKGGDLGWRQSGQLPTLFANIIITLAKGGHSDLIRSPSGFHLIQLEDKRVAKPHIVTQTQARHILIKADALTTEDDVILRLRQLKRRIEGGADFAELARANSADTASATKGGDLGWLNPGDTVPQFEQAMENLDSGQISEPFASPFGWHIVQVQKRRRQDDTEAFSRSQAKKFLRERKIDEMLESWLRQLREEAYVEIKA